MWSSITKTKVHTKPNKRVNKYLYNWILHHPQVVHNPIYNDRLKVSIDCHSEIKLVSKMLLQVYVQELHNRMVIPPEDSGINGARDVDNNIIISDCTLQSILTPQLNNMSPRYKVMCGCECCISAKIIHPSLLSWHDRYFKNLNDISQNSQTEGLAKWLIAYLRHIKLCNGAWAPYICNSS